MELVRSTMELWNVCNREENGMKATLPFDSISISINFQQCLKSLGKLLPNEVENAKVRPKQHRQITKSSNSIPNVPIHVLDGYAIYSILPKRSPRPKMTLCQTN